MARKYTIKARRSRVNLLDSLKASSLPVKLATLETAQEKRELIKEFNPLLYVFGEKLTPINWEYQDDL